mmetsp:Transcript_15232/g.45976  ORF Transcript_15232/g.45976 Transcript_15232/m.45976 type:complete len:298 (-) Transcript_15232:1583-2476(-)
MRSAVLAAALLRQAACRAGTQPQPHVTQQISQLQLLADLLDAVPAVRTLSHRWAGTTASDGSAAREVTTTALKAPTLGFQPSPPWHEDQSCSSVSGVRLLASDASSAGVAAAQAAPATAAATAATDIPDDSIPSDGEDDSRPGSGPAAQSGFLSRMSGTDLVKYMVIGMIIVLSVRVLPYIGMGTVESAQKLLGAETPFLQAAGASRLATIAEWSPSGAASVLGSGVVPKLQHLLLSSEDNGVRKECLNALLQLSSHPAGKPTMVRSGLPAALEQVALADLDGDSLAALRDLQSQLG